MASSSKRTEIFEFTKRKRWADLLITELADAILLILSPSLKIMFCGAGVTDLLGWKDTELLDTDFNNLVSFDDKIRFQNDFNTCLRSQQESVFYLRLQCRNRSSHAPTDYQPPTQEILFELKARPHYVTDYNSKECKCVFAVAKQYPSRNTALLNTFLELKIENERLQQRIQYLKAHGVTKSTRGLMAPPPPPRQRINTGHPSLYYSDGMRSAQTEYTPSPIRSVFNEGPSYGAGPLYPSASTSSIAPEDESPEDAAARRKKMKKKHNSEKYVCMTCGRTDSPEWRRGPTGPKTLCNACGLRWAKQVRKGDDGEGGEFSMGGMI